MIPGVERFYPRSSWVEPGVPVTGGTLFNWSRVVYVIIHYTAAASTPQTESGIRQWLRNSNGWWRRDKGYSLGYSFAFGRLGDVWEVRGYTFQQAATLGVNFTGPAFLCLVNGAGAATAAQTHSLRLAVRDVERRATAINARVVVVEIHDHNNVPGGQTRTACAGTGLNGQVYRSPISEFSPAWLNVDPNPTPPPEPVPPVPLPSWGEQNGDDMLVAFRIHPNPGSANAARDAAWGCGDPIVGRRRWMNQTMLRAAIGAGAVDLVTGQPVRRSADMTIITEAQANAYVGTLVGAQNMQDLAPR